MRTDLNYHESFPYIVLEDVFIVWNHSHVSVHNLNWSDKYVSMWPNYPRWRLCLIPDSSVDFSTTIHSSGFFLFAWCLCPHLQCGILSWGFKLSRLSKLQKRTIRVITCSKFNAHTEPPFKSLNLLNLEYTFSPNVYVLKLYDKLWHGNLSVYVTNLFTRIAPGITHNYDLRPSGISQTSTVHTIAERCILFMFHENSKDTHPNIREKFYTHSFQGFTKYLKATKIDSYATHCLIAHFHICQHI